MRLSRMAVKLEADSDEPGFDVSLPEIRIASQQRIGSLVCFRRDELLPEQDFLIEADPFLSL